MAGDAAGKQSRSRLAAAEPPFDHDLAIDVTNQVNEQYFTLHSFFAAESFHSGHAASDPGIADCQGCNPRACGHRRHAAAGASRPQRVRLSDVCSSRCTRCSSAAVSFLNGIINASRSAANSFECSS